LTKLSRYLPTIRYTLDLAGKWAPKDLNGKAIHAVNARKGWLALQENDLSQARRLLLSAAFGLPKDPNVTLWMGELYQHANQPARAWSQFAKAAMFDPPPVEAVSRLNLMNNDPAFRKGFHAADAELLLEGRIPVYAPSRQRGATEAPSAQLVEFFAHADDKRAVNAQLAFDALRTYFAGTDLQLVAYHSEPALADPIEQARRAFYQPPRPGTLVVDGAVLPPPPPNATAETIFQDWVKQLTGKPASEAAPIELIAGYRDGMVEVTAHPPKGTSEDARLHVLLVERCVLSFSKTGLPLQYAVVRRALTPADGSDAGGEASFVVPLAASAADASLDLDALLSRSMYLDPDEISVVAFVQDSKTRQILSVAVTPLRPARERLP